MRKPRRPDGTTLTTAGEGEEAELTVPVLDGGEPRELNASGNGPIDAFVKALRQTGVEIGGGETCCGGAPLAVVASFQAVISAMNRAER